MIKDITTDIRWKTPSSLFHLFFHRRNNTGAHLSTAAIHLVLQGSETGKVHGTILSYMDINHPVWLGRLSANDRKTIFYKPCVLCSHVSTIPLNGTGSLPHLIFQATSKWPGCLGWGCDLSLFPCICAQATSRSQNCVSRCFLCLSPVSPNQRSLLPCPCRLDSQPQKCMCSPQHPHVLPDTSPSS